MTEQTYNLPVDFFTANNICDLIDDQQLDRIGSTILQAVKDDINSRADWLERNDYWMKLVTQVMEEKSYPWKGASNIKFPLISTAAVQFHARAFPALLGNNKPVMCRTLGRDKSNLKKQRAERVGTFLSYQVTEMLDDWVGDMDRLLFILPIIGSLYKKTYFNEAKNRIVSELIHPRDLIINYDANDHTDARKTHRIWRLPNRIKEMQNRKLWRELPDGADDVREPSKQHSEPRDTMHGLQNPGKADDFSLQELYEVHTLLDLDDDGYMEPYVITMRASDGKVYRIVANYIESGMELTDDGDVIAIKPEDYFTHYFFLPDPESKTHGIGFGTMVGPINEAVNTLINILTDSGHMHSLGGGFLSRGVRIKGGNTAFKPNEWKPINATGDDIKKGIMPLPTKEPSMVLFNLLGLLIDSGKDLSSVQDQMVGRSPGQNQPFSTTQAVMEQGMKVFNGIYKRIYRSMTSEFKKFYKLNNQFPNVEMYAAVLDVDGLDLKEAMDAFGVQDVMKFLANDFNTRDLNIVPSAEPDMIAEMQKIARSQSLMQLMGSGIPLNPTEVTQRILEAEGHHNIPALMDVPEQGPPPEFQLEVQKFEHQKQMDALKERREQITAEGQMLLTKMQAALAFAKAQNEDVSGLHAQFIAEQKVITEEYNSVTKRIEAIYKNEQSGEATEQDAGAA